MILGRPKDRCHDDLKDTLYGFFSISFDNNEEGVRVIGQDQSMVENTPSFMSYDLCRRNMLKLC